MFEMLRRMIFPIIIIVLVVFTGMIVLQWGLDYSGQGMFERATTAGIVNGEEISWNEFQTIYGNLYESEAAKTNGEVTDARVRELEQLAFDQLVADKLILQEAQNRDVIVTDDDVYTYLKISPPAVFRQSSAFVDSMGRFNYQAYMSAMADPNYAPVWAQIEPEIRREVAKIRVQQLVTGAARVTDAEVRQSFINATEQIKIGAINVQTTLFYPEVPKPTEEEQRAYFDAHNDKYEVDERVMLKLVKQELTPSAADSAAAQRWAKEIYDSAVAGSDFAELAEAYSQDPGSAQNGGDLGWFGKGRMVKAFDSAAFAMEEGEISPPIETRFGWHVLKHFGYREENGKREAHVAHVLRKIEASTETLDNRVKKLDNFLESAQGESGFDGAAESEELEVYESGPLLLGQRIPFLGNTPETQVTEWAFEAKPGDISEIFRTRNGYAVATLVEKLPAGLADYAQVQDQVRSDLRQERAQTEARLRAEKAYEVFSQGMDLKQVAEETNLGYREIGPFTRMANLSALDSDPKAIGAAFSLLEPGDASGLVEYSNGYIIMELLERTPPDLTTFNEKIDSVRTALVQAKSQDAFLAWYDDVRTQAEIQNNLNWRSEM